MTGIDQASVHFEPGGLVLLNVILGLIMFGVALDLSLDDFKRIATEPRGAITGILTQLVFLPALTFLIITILDPAPSVALGMLLVAACPGGNVSNFLTHLGRGNASLSITTTAFSTAASVLATPFNVQFWGSMHPGTNALLTQVSLDPIEMLLTILTILGLPLVLGMTLQAKRRAWADKLRKPLKILSMVFLIAFITVALANNFGPFLEHIETIFWLVLVHNAAAFSLGYLTARIAGLPPADRRAITMEVGIQNSGLGLVLIFTFFGGLGGMAVIAGWWGVWHILAGSTLVAIWRRI